jgi:hypothetical protein
LNCYFVYEEKERAERRENVIASKGIKKKKRKKNQKGKRKKNKE